MAKEYFGPQGQKIIRWFRIGKRRVPVYEKNISASKQTEPINLNGTEYSKDGFRIYQYDNIATKYSDIEDYQDMAWQFAKDTGVQVQTQGLNKESLGMALDAVAQIQSEYGCTVTSIQNATPDLLAKSPDSYAWMGADGTLYLNSDIFSQDRNSIESIYARDVETHWHPKGNAQSIIVHEMGHAVFNRYIQNVMNDAEDIQNNFVAWGEHWDAIHDYVAGDSYGINFDVDMYRNSAGYKQIVDMFDLSSGSLATKVKQEPYLLKRWGGTPFMSLSGLAQYKFNYDDAISNYAGKNITEMVAEAFADVYMNKDDASFMSKFIYGEVLEGMKR